MNDLIGKVRVFRVVVEMKSGPVQIMIVIAQDKDEAVAFATAQARFEGHRPEAKGHKAIEMFRSPLQLGVLTRLK